MRANAVIHNITLKLEFAVFVHANKLDKCTGLKNAVEH